MIVKLGSTWLPFTSIREITDEPAGFIAPRRWDRHAQVTLNTGECIRIEGMSAAAVATDINRQIAQAHRLA